MKLELDQTINLDGTAYHVTGGPFHGFVSDVYLATLVEVDLPVVIKLVRHDAPNDQKKIEALNNEANTLRILNLIEDTQWASLSDVIERAKRAYETAVDRYIIANLVHGEIAPGQPYLIQEMAPPEFERIKIESIADEIRTLEVAAATAHAMATVHSQKLTLKDFAPPTKFDRLRVSWNNDGRLIFKLIDWNITGTPDEYREKGPEDMFYFAQYLYFMLTGAYIALNKDDLPPADLSIASDNWSNISEGSRQILQKALQRNPRLRYQRPDDIAEDLDWWVNTLKISQSDTALSRLEDRGWQARQKKDHSRALAVSHLALLLDIPEDKRRNFERWEEQSRQELEKRVLGTLVDGRSSLLIGAYEKAIREFNEVLLKEDNQSVVARHARLYQMQAEIGRDLQAHYDGADIRQKEEWRSIEISINQMREGKWVNALNALRAAEKTQPQLTDKDLFSSFYNLLTIAQQYIAYEEQVSRQKPAIAPPSPTDPRWIQIEGEKLDQFQQIVAQLQKSTELASKEPFFLEQYQIESAAWQARKNRYDIHVKVEQNYQLARQKLQAGLAAQKDANWAEAEKLFREASDEIEAAVNDLAQLPQSEPRTGVVARQLQDLQVAAQTRYSHAQNMAAAVVKRSQANEAVRKGEYQQADQLAREAEDLDPGDSRMKDVLKIAESGGRILRQIDTKLNPIRLQLQSEKLTLAELQESQQTLDKLTQWQGQSFPNLTVTDVVAFPETLREEINHVRTIVQERLNQTREQITTAYRQAREAADTGAYKLVERYAEQIQALNPDHKELASLLAESRAGLQIVAQIEEALKKATGEIFVPGRDNEQELRTNRETISEMIRWHGLSFVAILPSTQDLPANRQYRLENAFREQLTKQSRRLGRELDKIKEYKRKIAAIEAAGDNRRRADLFKELVQRLKRIDHDDQPVTVEEADFNRYLAEADWKSWHKITSQVESLTALRQKLGQDILDLPQLEAIIAELEELGDAASVGDWRKATEKWELMCKRDSIIAHESVDSSLKADLERRRELLERGQKLFSDLTQTVKNESIKKVLKNAAESLEIVVGKITTADDVQKDILETITDDHSKEDIISLHEGLTALQDSWYSLEQEAKKWQNQFDTEILPKYLSPLADKVEKYQREAQEDLPKRDEPLQRMLEAIRSGWEELPRDLQERCTAKHSSLFNDAARYMRQRQAAQSALDALLKQHGRTDEYRTATQEKKTILAPILDELPELYASDLKTMLTEIEIAAQQEQVYAEQPVSSAYAQYIKKCQEHAQKEIVALVRRYPDVDKIFDSYKKRLQRRAGEIFKKLQEAIDKEKNKIAQQLTAVDDISTFHSPKEYLSYYWQLRWLERFAATQMDSQSSPEALTGTKSDSSLIDQGAKSWAAELPERNRNAEREVLLAIAKESNIGHDPSLEAVVKYFKQQVADGKAKLEKRQRELQELQDQKEKLESDKNNARQQINELEEKIDQSETTITQEDEKLSFRVLTWFRRSPAAPQVDNTDKELVSKLNQQKETLENALNQLKENIKNIEQEEKDKQETIQEQEDSLRQFKVNKELLEHIQAKEEIEPDYWVQVKLQREGELLAKQMADTALGCFTYYYDPKSVATGYALLSHLKLLQRGLYHITDESDKAWVTLLADHINLRIPENFPNDVMENIQPLLALAQQAGHIPSKSNNSD